MDVRGTAIASFLRRPPETCRLVVLYGTDVGLIRERAQALVAAAASAPDDPFQAVTLAADDIRNDPGRLLDEAQAIPMFGGRRVVRVRDAGDGLTGPLADLLRTPAAEALTIVEAGGLGKTARLVKLALGDDAAAGIACYPDDSRSLADVIRETLDAAGLSATLQAQGLLQAALGDNRADTRARLETLVLYKGEDRSPVSEEDVRAILADAPETRVGDLSDAILAGRTETALRQLDRCLENGMAAGSLIRMLGTSVRQVRRARVEGRGRPDRQLVQRLFRLPPDRTMALTAAAARWDERMLERAETALFEAERQTRRNTASEAAILGQTVLWLSRIGARGARQDPQ